MSGIGSIPFAERKLPVDEPLSLERDGVRPRKRVRRTISQEDLVEIEPHQLDLEA